MTGHIYIEGEIGKNSAVSVKSVRDDISLYPDAKEFQVHVNSGGGEVYEGQAISRIITNELRAKGIRTTAKIGAVCGSIATDIAQSCDKVEMGNRGDFMIHLPTGTIEGNAETMRKGAVQLDRITAELIDKYMTRVARKGVTREQLVKMITEEKSMSPKEAFEFGFIDELIPDMKPMAKIDFNNMADTIKLDEQTKGLFADFGKKLDEFLAKFKHIKNVSVTLADSRVCESSSDDPANLVGSTLQAPDGTPIPDGQVETADGYVLTIAGGKVTKQEPKPQPKPDEEEEVEAMKKENAALKEEIANLKKSTVDQSAAVAKQEETIKAQMKDFATLKSEFEKFKNQTFGDETLPPDGDKTKTVETIDPVLKAMTESLYPAYKTSR